jgi:hypothetical protein
MSGGHDGGHESAGHGGESLLGKGFSSLMGGFTKLALAFGILVGGVALAPAVLPGIAAAATSFFSGSVVIPNYMLAAGGAGFLLGSQTGKGHDAPKKEKAAAHGPGHH